MAWRSTLTRSKYDVIIIGAGIAGLAAADLLAGHHLKVLLVDENSHPGGQLLRYMPHTQGRAGRFEPSLMRRRGLRLLDRLRRQPDMEILQHSQVVGIYPENHLLIEDGSGKISEPQAAFVLCATGARERFLPFKGWTLPGVLATGAAQILVKGSAMLPAAELLIAGCGPLPLIVAAEILRRKGRVRALLDSSGAQDRAGVWRQARQWPRLLEGAFYLCRILAAGTPFLQSTRVLEARGTNRLEAVVAARFDDQGGLIPGTETIHRIDTLAVGNGFAPNIELLQQAGCEVRFDRAKGGWFAQVDAQMATSVENLYAAGEATGIAGAEKSYLEGQIAARSILHRCSLVQDREFAVHLDRLTRQRQQQLHYGRFLNALCRVPAGYYENLAEETTICRCEEITLGAIRRELANGFHSLGAIKKATGCGMGNCQGRICGLILSDLLAVSTCSLPEQSGPLSIRSPVKPIRLGALAAADEPPGFIP